MWHVFILFPSPSLLTYIFCSIHLLSKEVQRSLPLVGRSALCLCLSDFHFSTSRLYRVHGPRTWFLLKAHFAVVVDTQYGRNRIHSRFIIQVASSFSPNIFLTTARRCLNQFCRHLLLVNKIRIIILLTSHLRDDLPIDRIFVYMILTLCSPLSPTY